MPRGDRTGPMGMGPMTGRRAGFCSGFEIPGFAGFWGFGGGFGGGRGRGFRRMFYATGAPGWARYDDPTYAGAAAAGYDQKTILSNQAEYLENQLQEIKKRLSDLDKEDK